MLFTTDIIAWISTVLRVFDFSHAGFVDWKHPNLKARRQRAWTLSGCNPVSLKMREASWNISQWASEDNAGIEKKMYASTNFLTVWSGVIHQSVPGEVAFVTSIKFCQSALVESVLFLEMEKYIHHRGMMQYLLESEKNWSCRLEEFCNVAAWNCTVTGGPGDKRGGWCRSNGSWNCVSVELRLKKCAKQWDNLCYLCSRGASPGFRGCWIP